MLHIASLAENIKKYRKARGLSQSDLAAVLNVSPQSVSKWECAQAVPDVENLCLAAETLGVSLDALVSHGEKREKVMLAADGGGSKTEFLVFSESGRILERSVYGGCNPNTVGLEECIRILSEGIRARLDTHSVLSGVYIGAAGLLSGGARTAVEDALKKRFPQLRIQCGGDLPSIAASALTDDDRYIAVISGTGSSVLVKENGRMTRYGGYGYRLSRGGSGYDIGRDAVYATVSALDGVGETTELTGLVCAALGRTVPDILRGVYAHDVSYTASVAVSVFEAAAHGDPTAETILRTNASALADIIREAYSRHPHVRTVVLSGSILLKNPTFSEEVRTRLDPSLRTVIPKTAPAVGACILCARLCGVSTDGLLEKLSESYEKGEQYYVENRNEKPQNHAY